MKKILACFDKGVTRCRYIFLHSRSGVECTFNAGEGQSDSAISRGCESKHIRDEWRTLMEMTKCLEHSLFILQIIAVQNRSRAGGSH